MKLIDNGKLFLATAAPTRASRPNLGHSGRFGTRLWQPCAWAARDRTGGSVWAWESASGDTGHWPCPASEDTFYRSGLGSGSVRCRVFLLLVPMPPCLYHLLGGPPQWSPLCQLAGSMGSSWTVQTIRPGSQWRNMAPGLTARRPRQHPGLELDRRQVATGRRAGQAPCAAPGGCSEDPGSLCLMAVPQGAPSPVQRGTAQQPSCLQRPRPGRASWHCP